MRKRKPQPGPLPGLWQYTGPWNSRWCYEHWYHLHLCYSRKGGGGPGESVDNTIHYSLESFLFIEGFMQYKLFIAMSHSWQHWTVECISTLQNRFSRLPLLLCNSTNILAIALVQFITNASSCLSKKGMCTGMTCLNGKSLTPVEFLIRAHLSGAA